MKLFKKFRASMPVLSVLVGMCALFFLRLQVVSDLKLTFSQAMGIGLYLGWLYDLAFLLIGLGLACIFGSSRGWVQRTIWSSYLFALFILSLSSVLYFRFFGTRLYFWTVRLHLSDVFLVKSSAESLGLTPQLIGAVCWMVIALFLAMSIQTIARKNKIAWGVGWVILGFMLRQSPVWVKRVAFQDRHLTGQVEVLTEHVFVTWWNELTGLDGGMHSELRAEMQHNAIEDPGKLLSQFRLNNAEQENAFRDLTEQDDPVFPLIKTFAPRFSRVKAWRERLGLPESEKINVVFLFLESTRALELLHPDIGPELMPKLKSWLKRNADFYTQAYSSSNEAGQTVRGQFSALCSMFPNIGGPAPTIAFNALKIVCLPRLFQQAGYQTVWMNTLKKTFHSADAFESIHGTDRFIDEATFLSRGVTLRRGDWGLADYPFLEESVKILNELAQSDRPFFVNMLTSSTHFPHVWIPEARLSDKLMQHTNEFPEHRNYLSQLNYLDQALDHFFKKLFDSPIGNNTLVVLSADHSIPVAPYLNLSREKIIESRYRIPIALITKHHRSPREWVEPVHQIDLAPTVAEIAGVSGRVAWLGKSLYFGSGTPWMFRMREEVSFRRGKKVCYTESQDQTPQCYEIRKGQDPLFTPNLSPIAFDPSEIRYFSDIMKATRQLIVFNHISPIF